MRVIAGTAKGRTLAVARGGATRSATDRIRETLFAILEPVLAEADVLDLFAGAGTLGIEALSRGAARVTFVERSTEALQALRKNLASTGFEDRSKVIARSVVDFLGRSIAGPYDVVFLDPPFDDVALLEATLAHAHLAAALAPDALVVARVLKKHLPTLPGGVSVSRAREIGEETLLFLRYDADGGGG